MTPKDTFENWKYSFVQGLFWEKGIVNDTVFLSYLDSKLPKKDKITRKIVVGTTDSQTGNFVRFTEKLSPHELAYKAGRASTAIPGFFEYVNFKNKTFIDGGVVINLDIGGAVARCQESGFKNKDIIIDIVMCSGNLLKDVNPENFTAAQMLYRYYEITQFQKTMIWISQGLSHWPDVNYRYIVYPKKSLDKGILPIPNFNTKHLKDLVQIGRNDAKETILAGEGFKLNQIHDSWFGSANNPFNVEFYDPDTEENVKHLFDKYDI